MDDEELGAGGVGVVGAGHGDGAPLMGQGVVPAVGGELAHDLMLGAAGAVALGIAALNHKAVHDAVEGQAVIEAAVGQLHEVGAGDGSGFLVQLHSDGTVVLHVDAGSVGHVLFQSGGRVGVGAGGDGGIGRVLGLGGGGGLLGQHHSGDDENGHHHNGADAPHQGVHLLGGLGGFGLGLGGGVGIGFLVLFLRHDGRFLSCVRLSTVYTKNGGKGRA